MTTAQAERGMRTRLIEIADDHMPAHYCAEGLHVRLVDAVLLALREPSEGMVRDGAIQSALHETGDNDTTARCIFTAMIDAILSERTEGEN